jgi:hypothetical protein
MIEFFKWLIDKISVYGAVALEWLLYAILVCLAALWAVGFILKLFESIADFIRDIRDYFEKDDEDE